MIEVEICCNSIASAIAAREGCAERIELCQDLECGGLTPADEAIAYCSRHLGLRTHVLVRPRAGNFCYSSQEQSDIIASIKRCRELGAAAVVVGFLTADGQVDVELTRQMVRLAAPMEVTFHRAFDEALQDPVEALWAVAAARCHRLLTSGQKATAMEGSATIAQLVGATGVEILAGSGVTPSNVCRLVQATGVREVHGSCKKVLDDGSIVTDAATVRQMIDRTLTL